LLHIWERHNGANNGQIVYAVRDAVQIGLSKATAARALTEAIELGFLRVTRSSSFTLKTKEAREWALTAEPIDGRPATKDFMRWLAPKFETRSHQRDRQSHQRDRDPENGAEIGISVSPKRPSAPDKNPPRSHQRDTSNLPGRAGGALPQLPEVPAKQRRPPRFGDLAKAQRIARIPERPDAE
jgi:hypothetical protein